MIMEKQSWTPSVLPQELAAWDDGRLDITREQVHEDYPTAESLRLAVSSAEPIIVDLPDGRQTIYYYFAHPDGGDRRTVVHFQPVANGLKPQAVPRIAAIQRLTATNVLFMPQNSTTLTASELNQLRKGNFGPLADQRLFSLKHAHDLGHVSMDALNLDGYSWGATEVSALIKKMPDSGEIDSAVLAEPANIIKRSLGRLGFDFASPSSSKLLDAVRMSSDPALIELWGAGDIPSSFMEDDITSFAKDLLRPANLVGIAGLRYPGFANDVIAGLSAFRENSRLLLGKDRNSILTPISAFGRQVAQIGRAAMDLGLPDIFLNVTYISTEQGLGHASGDNPYIRATLIRMALQAA